MTKYSNRNKCEFWQTEPDAVQGGECAAVRALQAGANAATRRLWQPKTHLFMSEYLDVMEQRLLTEMADLLNSDGANYSVFLRAYSGVIATSNNPSFCMIEAV
jgi:hypothetical protein